MTSPASARRYNNPGFPRAAPLVPWMGGKRRLAVGVVTSDKMNKTRRVEIPRLVKHPRYGKYIKRRTVCYTHDENNEYKDGDLVEIVACRKASSY